MRYPRSPKVQLAGPHPRSKCALLRANHGPYRLIPTSACGRIDASPETEWPIVFQQPTVQRSATVVASALMLLVHRISKAMPGGPALDSMARPLLMRRGGRRKMARRQAFHSQNEGCQEPAL